MHKHLQMSCYKPLSEEGKLKQEELKVKHFHQYCVFNKSSLALDSQHYCTAFNDRDEFKVLARIDFIYISLSLQDALQLGVGFSVEKVVQLEGERSNAATVLQPCVMHSTGTRDYVGWYLLSGREQTHQSSSYGISVCLEVKECKISSCP